MGARCPYAFVQALRPMTSLTWDWMRYVARPTSLRLLGLTLVIVLPTTRPSLAKTAVEWAFSSILAASLAFIPNGSSEASTMTGMKTTPFFFPA